MKKAHKKGLTNIQRDIISGYLFFLPWIIGFLVFTLYPMFFSVQMSFNEVTVRPGEIFLEWQAGKYYDYAWNVDTTFKLQLGNAILFICTYRHQQASGFNDGALATSGKDFTKCHCWSLIMFRARRKYKRIHSCVSLARM